LARHLGNKVPGSFFGAIPFLIIRIPDPSSVGWRLEAAMVGNDGFPAVVVLKLACSTKGSAG
jgi:hypothetical protein